jgi:hypothetical protein
MVHALVTHPDIKSADLSSVIAVNSGAAYLPPELAARMGRLLQSSSEITQGVLYRLTFFAPLTPHRVRSLRGCEYLLRIPLPA